MKCPDCRLDPADHESLASALKENAISDAERRTLARRALSPAAPEPTFPVFCAVAATVVAATLLFVALHNRFAETRPHLLNGSVAEQRKANEKFLKTPAVQEKLAKAPKGSFVVIAGGDEIEIGKDLDALLAKAKAKHPDARQRFVFRAGEQGDKRYESTWPYVQVMGMRFLDLAKLPLQASWHGTKPGDDRLFASLEVGPPAGEDRWPDLYLLATGYSGPLMLPAGRRYPRFEIPGTATVKDGISGLPKGRAFRRYLVRVVCAKPKRDLLCEALGPIVDVPRIDVTCLEDDRGSRLWVALQGKMLLLVRGIDAWALDGRLHLPLPPVRRKDLEGFVPVFNSEAVDEKLRKRALKGMLAAAPLRSSLDTLTKAAGIPVRLGDGDLRDRSVGLCQIGEPLGNVLDEIRRHALIDFHLEKGSIVARPLRYELEIVDPNGGRVLRKLQVSLQAGEATTGDQLARFLKG